MPLILIVEDEPVISMMLEDWLDELGHRTLGPAADVASALSFIEKSPPDAAILDVSLGQETGYPVADCLAGRNIRFAFSTGFGASDLPARFDGTPVIVKPFDFTDLKSALQHLLFNN